jgi:hypothetical protein
MAARTKSPNVPSSRERRWVVYAAVALLLTWYFISSQTAVATKSVTFDETLHLTGGLSYWKYGDFRLHCENGNLPQRWAAIPLFLSGTHFPQLTPDEWRNPSTQIVGDSILYGAGNDADSTLMRSRAIIGLLGVALGLLIFLWTRSLLGTGAAFVCLGLFAFCPSMLAQGALATSDMATTLFFTASVLCIWRVLHVVNWQRVLVGGLVLGCLFVAKFSAILILPMAFLLLAVQLASRKPTLVSLGGKTWTIERRHLRLLVHLMTFAVQAAIVLAVIWSFYNFRYGMFATQPEGNADGNIVAANVPEIPWNDVVDQSKVVDRFIVGMRDRHLLPEGFLFGFAIVMHNARDRAAFLNGDFSLHGWPQFFPYCVLVKTPITLFVLLVLAAAWIIHYWYSSGETWQPRRVAIAGSLYRTSPLWTSFAVYWVFAVTSHLNIGHRHVLPTYPPMLMFAGCSWLWVTQRKPVSALSSADRSNGWIKNWIEERRYPLLAIAVLVSLTSFAAESLSNWPNYLAYFNQFVGSRSNAYRHLVDSSLDWGQDLPALKRWLVETGLDDSPGQKPYLSYFGTGNPDYYGIHATLLPGFWDRNPPRIPQPLQPGTYCISATILQNLYTKFPGRWNVEYEDTYQQLAEKVRLFNSSNREKRDQLIAADGQTAWANWLQTYEQARLARLTSFLRRREPDSEINYSILVYLLSAEDLDRAINGPPIELLESADFSKQ